MSPHTDLAKKAIYEFLNFGKVLKSSDAPEILQRKKAACFVSLHTKEKNDLRGCIGTIIPVCKNLAAEIISNAISACNDPRFSPLGKKELDNIDITVDVLSLPEPIDTLKKLNPKIYGVIVQAPDGRSGVLLPDLEGVDTSREQVNIACNKAGIDPNEKYSLFRFTAKRFH